VKSGSQLKAATKVKETAAKRRGRPPGVVRLTSEMKERPKKVKTEDGPDLPFRCLDCQKTDSNAAFASMEELEGHSKANHYEKDYLCQICDKVLPSFNLFYKQHLRQHCTKDQDGFPICPFCQKQMGRYDPNAKTPKTKICENYGHLSTHLPPKYWSDNLNCSVCKRRHYCLKTRLKHEQTHHPKEMGLEPAPKLPCPNCKMVFLRREYLNRHVKMKHHSPQCQDTTA